MSIEENLKQIRNRVDEAARNCGRPPSDITLIGVSKRKPAQCIQEAIDAGHRDFGENYIQEAMEKIDRIGRDSARWHFIGHLQSNKVRFAVRYFDLIHTVDKLKRASEIHRIAEKEGKIQDILIQINIAEEETKSGADASEVIDLVTRASALTHIRICGLMCMPPFFDDPELARPYFKRVREIGAEIAALNLPNVSMDQFSMGMSNDFEVAVEEGATLVRVGTAIFGRRD